MSIILANNKSLACTEDDMEDTILGVAEGNIAYRDLSLWIEAHIYR